MQHPSAQVNILKLQRLSAYHMNNVHDLHVYHQQHSRGNADSPTVIRVCNEGGSNRFGHRKIPDLNP